MPTTCTVLSAVEVEVGGNVSFQCNSWGWNIPHSPLVMMVYTGLKGSEDKWIELLVAAGLMAEQSAWGQWVCLRCKPGVCAGGPKKTIRARVQEEGLHWESGEGSRNESEWGLSRSKESGLGGRLWKRRCPGAFIGVGSSKPVSLKTQGWDGEGPANMKNKFI